MSHTRNFKYPNIIHRACLEQKYDTITILSELRDIACRLIILNFQLFLGLGGVRYIHLFFFIFCQNVRKADS